MDSGIDIVLHALQLNLVVGDITGNTNRIVDYIRGLESRPDRINIVVTSELAVCGYAPQDMLLQDSFIERSMQAVEAIAETIDRKTYVLVGHPAFAPERGVVGQRRLINAASLLHGGEILRTFSKTLLPTYNIFDESRYFEPCGDPSDNIFYIAGIPFGVTICEDIWNEGFALSKEKYNTRPVSELRKNGAEFVINLSASPYCLDKEKERADMIRGICDTYGIGMMYVNQVGANDSLVFDGRSIMCVDGKMHKYPAFLECAREMGRLRVHGRNVSVSTTGGDDQRWLDRTWNIRKTIVTGIRDYFRKLGLTTAIVSMSGGIDSALTAACAVEALGAENVIGVTQPSKFNTDETKGDAYAQAENMGIRFIDSSIKAMHDVAAERVLNALGDIVSLRDPVLGSEMKGFGNDVTDQNIQARLRGMIVMALSNDIPGSIVLATGNKSEFAMGYYTLYGDSCGGLAVLGDVYKTQVFEVSEYYADDTDDGPKWIPRSVISRPPSAELADDQEDTDSLPPYDILDAALKIVIDRDGNVSDQEALETFYSLYFGHCPSYTERSKRVFGVDEYTRQSGGIAIARAFLRKVAMTVVRNEHKRYQSAPCFRLNKRPWNVGWQYPIVARHQF